MNIDPKTIGLLAASAGFLDPRGGMMGGIASGLGAYAAANQMKSAEATQEMNQRKLLRQLQLENHLQELTAKHGNDPASLSKALMSSPYPEAMKMGIDLSKARQVKQFLKTTDESGKPVYRPGFNTGEVGDAVAPISEKLAFQNLGNQTVALDPYTGKPVTSYAQGMSPGESARLAQSERHFGASHALAQQNSDLSRLRTMMDYDPEYQAQKAGMISSAKETAKIRSDVESKLPETVGVLAETLNLSDDLKTHPALNSMVGAFPKRIVGQGLAAFGGNKQADFAAKLEQAQGKQFLSAIQAMRGFGQLTEREGDKMQSSAAAMSVAQSPEDFRKAQNDYQAALLSGVRKVAQKLNMPESQILEMLNKERETLKQDSTSFSNQSNPDGWGDLR